MRIFHRFAVPALCGLLLLQMPSVSAQSFESFFDVLKLPDLQCDPCEQLRREVDELMADKAGLEEDLSLLDGLMTDLETDMQTAKDTLAEQEADLEEFLNPTNFVESDGRRYDSSDHAAMRLRTANLWARYKAGKMSAEQYSEEAGKAFDDPTVQKELSKLKKEIERDLRESIKNLKASLSEMEVKHAEWDEIGQELTRQLHDVTAKLNELQKALEDCLKRCKTEPVDVPKDYGIGQTGGGFFDWIRGLFGGDEVFTVPQFTGEPLPNGGIIDLPVPDPLPTDSFFDVFVDINLPPPVCHVCDPIRKELVDAQAKQVALNKQLAQQKTQGETLNTSRQQAATARDNAQTALDEFMNPSSYVEDDQGNRYDSSDHVATRERNARLWADYKADRLSAEQLSGEWGKSFHDPDVQAELATIKKAIQKKLEQAVKDATQKVADLEKEAARLAAAMADTEAKLAKLAEQIAGLIKQLGECEKKCAQLPPTGDMSALIQDFVPELLLDDEDDMDIEADVEEEEEEEEVDEDEDVGMEIPATEFKPNGFFCGVPVLRAITCNDQEVEDDMDIDTGIADFTQPYVCCDGAQTEDCKPCEQKTNWLCSSFKLFCSKPKFMTYDLSNCFTGQSDSKVCNSFAWDWTDEDESPEFFLKNSDGLEFPLFINGLDGNNTFDPEDIVGLGECLQNGPSNCAGLDFGMPGGGEIFTDGFESGQTESWGLGARDQHGKDVLFSDPVNRDVINVGGGSNDILSGGPDAFPDDLLGPGDDRIIGGPPSVDILGGDSPVSEPSVANDARARQVAQAAVQAYLQRNPLGPCEKLVVSVTRVRIGNRVRYTVKIKRVQDDALCPPFVEDDADEDDLELGCQFDEDCNDGDECTKDTCDRETSQCANEYIEGCGEPVCGDGILDQKTEECEQDAHCRSGTICNVEDCTCQEKVQPMNCGDGITSCEESSDCAAKEYCQAGCCAPIPSGIKSKCPDFAHDSESDCKRECNGDCRVQKYEDASCYFCVPSEEPVKVSCDFQYMELPQCKRTCNGTCDKEYTTSSGTECFSCIKEEESLCGNGVIEDNEECDDGNTKNGDGCDAKCRREPEDIGPDCPNGTTSSYPVCESQCASQGGSCIEKDGCYSCVVVNCPSGTFKDECPSSCSSGCDVAGSQNGVTCYQCKQSCEDVCAQHGYGGPNTDHSSAILSELNGYSCVSGANISIQTATIGSCQCIGEYSLSVNQTPPVCSGTPCGDVTCGSSATCAEGDTTVTVNCNWGGWEQIGKQQFRPKLGN